MEYSDSSGDDDDIGDTSNFFFLFFILRRYKFLIYKFTSITMNIIHKNRRMLISM